MPKTTTQTIDRGEVGVRLDAFVAQAARISRADAVRRIEAALVRVNGAVVPKGRVLERGDTVEIDEAESVGWPRPDVRYEVLFSDDRLLVVHKPPGVHTVEVPAGNERVLARAVAFDHPDLLALGPPDYGACHRLDEGTSGVVIFARTEDLYVRVREAFSNHRVEKTYRALVASSPPDEWRVDVPIGHPRRRADHVVTAEGRGLVEASTAFRTIRRYDGCALVEAVTRTGARHQIRAHLAHSGCPILGDPLYGGPSVSDGRLRLHARSVHLPDPEDRTRELRFACEPDDRFFAFADVLANFV